MPNNSREVMDKPMLTVVILAKNEEIHIQRVVENVREWATAVFVVDSFSDDCTKETAAACGARVFQHPFSDYAAQREWALRSLPYPTDWMLFLDADELVTDELKREIIDTLERNPAVSGYYLKRRVYWMGTWLRHGGMYPTWLLRLVRHRYAQCHPRAVNEHLEVEGETAYLEHDLLHVDLKPLSDWVAKHNRYSTSEAEEQLKIEVDLGERTALRPWGGPLERKRWLRRTVWDGMLPPLLRPFLYFVYAYVVRLGFLDGRSGLIYHTLQGLAFWFVAGTKYRMLKESGSEAVNPHDLAGRLMA